MEELLILLKQIWFAIFVTFFRITRWRGDMQAHAAIAGILIVEGFLLISISCWAQVLLGRQLTLARWVVWPAVALLYAVNYYQLVVKGSGLAFNREFSRLSQRRQIALYSAVGLLVAVTVTIFFMSLATYHRAFFGSP